MSSRRGSGPMTRAVELAVPQTRYHHGWVIFISINYTWLINWRKWLICCVLNSTHSICIPRGPHLSGGISTESRQFERGSSGDLHTFKILKIKWNILNVMLLEFKIKFVMGPPVESILRNEEKRYLLMVERGDYNGVRRFVKSITFWELFMLYFSRFNSSI